MPCVSVIIPTYNRATQVAQAVRSVLAQTFEDFEIVVIDDGSTDDTRQVLQTLAAQDARLVCHFQTNRGRSAARNAGIGLARGDYLAFLDSDDLFLPHKLQRQVKAMRSQPDCCMTYHPILAIDETGAPMYGGHPLPGRLSGHIYPELLFIKGTVITTPSVMTHTALVRQLGGFDQSMHVCEDLDLWRRIARRSPVLQLDEPLAVVCYRRNEPLALAEKMAARQAYYQKAFSEDPALQRQLRGPLWGEMYWTYGSVALHHSDRARGWLWIGLAAWYDLPAFWRQIRSRLQPIVNRLNKVRERLYDGWRGLPLAWSQHEGVFRLLRREWWGALICRWQVSGQRAAAHLLMRLRQAVDKMAAWTVALLRGRAPASLYTALRTIYRRLRGRL